MTFLCIIFGLITVIFAAVLLMDAVPCAMTWVQRIGIGSSDKEEAAGNIIEVAIRWLLKTPSVPLSDETRLTVIDRVKGQYKSNTLQSWQKAALLLGADEADREKEVKEFIFSQLNADGTFKNFVKSPDFSLLAYAMLKASDDKELLRSGAEKVYGFLKECAGDGTVPYNMNIPDIRFVDTLGMVCPFLMIYATLYDCEEARLLAKKQLSEYKKHGIDAVTGLPVHCFNVKTNAPLGILGWGRGCGWYALALAEMLRVSDDDDVLETAEAFSEKIMKYQLPNGGFSRQILAESTGEASATAMICHLFAVLYRLTGKKEYKECSVKGTDFIRLSTRKNGKVDYAQGDTKGIGFYSQRLDTMPAAQGFSCLLMSEVNV